MRRCSALSIATALGLLALGGCQFKIDVPAGRTVTCSGAPGAAPCPDGYACRPNIGRCVPLSELNSPAPALVDPSVSPAIGNLGTTFTLAFGVSRTLAHPPVVYATDFRLASGGGSVGSYPFACGACAVGERCSCTLTFDPAQPPQEGPLRLWVELVDQNGNAPPPLSVGSVLLDATPPALAHPATLEFTPLGALDLPVSALSTTSSAEVCFTVTEPLAATPVVSAADGGVPFGLEPGFPLGQHYCFLGAVPASGAPQGPTPITADLEDLAGNTARVELTGLEPDAGSVLVVDTTPPPAPDTSLEAGLLFHRAPWGELPALGQPRYWLGSRGAGLGEAGTLFVYEDAARERPVLRAPVGAGALTPIELPPPDRRELWVDLYDRAGNAAPGGPFHVRNEEWVASLGGKHAGDPLSNPHDCYARPVTLPTLAQADDDVRAVDGPDLLGDGGVVVVGGGSWRRRWPGAPTQLFFGQTGSYMLSYDSSRARAVLLLANVSGMETWEYDGDWRLIDVGNGPTYRDWGAMAYDASRGRTVLFGGALADTLCDTWEWDGTTWRVGMHCAPLPDGGSTNPDVPSPRQASAMAYDARRGRTVLFGGANPSGASLGDLWEYDGRHWAPLTLTPGGPGPLSEASMGYATFPDGGAALALLGGTAGLPDGGTADSNQLWFGSWDGAGYRWSAPSAALCSGVLPCGALPLAADPVAHELVTAIGTSEGNQLLHWTGDHWGAVTAPPSEEIDGLLWAPVEGHDNFLIVGTNGVGPLAGYQASFRCVPGGSCALDHNALLNADPGADQALGFSPDGHALMVGGHGFGGNSNDSFTWSGQDWDGPYPEDPTPRPSPRSGGGLTFVPSDGRFWYLGGHDWSSFAGVFDLWAMTPGGDWEQLALPDGGWPDSPQVAWVPDAGAVLEAGEGKPTRLLHPGVVGPSVDELAHVTPGGSMAFDATRGRAVLIEPTGVLDELSPDGGWSQALAGAPLSNARAFYDSQQGRVLLFGTPTGDEVPGDVWSYDGQSEWRIPVVDPEGDGVVTDIEQAMAFDPVRGTILSFGGSPTNNPYRDDTWEFHVGADRPAEVCALRYAYAGAPEGTEVRGLSITALAGAEGGGASGQVASDAVLQVYRGGLWQDVGRCRSSDGGCSLEAPGPITLDVADPGLAADLLTQRSTLGVAVTPALPNGPGLARVRVDAVQARFDLRLP